MSSALNGPLIVSLMAMRVMRKRIMNIIMSTAVMVMYGPWLFGVIAELHWPRDSSSMDHSPTSEVRNFCLCEGGYTQRIAAFHRLGVRPELTGNGMEILFKRNGARYGICKCISPVKAAKGMILQLIPCQCRSRHLQQMQSSEHKFPTRWLGVALGVYGLAWRNR